MPFAELQVNLDDAEIKTMISERIEALINAELIYWDIEQMTKRLCMGRTFLESEFLQDPRMKLIERRKGKGKRFWPYKKSVEVIQEIMDEWD